LIESANTLIVTANETEVSVPKIKNTNEEIEEQTKELKAADYSSVVKLISRKGGYRRFISNMILLFMRQSF